MNGQCHLQGRCDDNQKGVQSVLRLQGQPAETHALRPLAATSRQGGMGRTEAIEVLRRQHPALQMGQKLGLVERRQRGGQPDSLLVIAIQQLLLKNFEGAPPEAAHPGFIAGSRTSVPGQTLPQGLKAVVAHHRPSEPTRLCRTTDRQRPRQMKLTSIAERP